jgi:cell division GTPase FtsZ
MSMRYASDMSEEKGQNLRVVLVGHCGFDASSIRRLVEKTLPNADTSAVNRQADLDAKLDAPSVLLINRVLDGRFAAGSAYAMIAELAQRDEPPQMMLVSNFDEAQEQAVAAGARPGFGKSDLSKPETAQRLRDAAAAATAPA